MDKIQNQEKLALWNGRLRRSFRYVAYVLLPGEDGKTPPKSKSFPPGTEVIIERFLCVGTSPAQAYGRAMAKLGEVGKLYLSLTDPTGNAISTARVDIKRDEKSIPAYPDAQGIVEISLPLGEWQLTAKDNGREALEEKSLSVRTK